MLQTFDDEDALSEHEYSQSQEVLREAASGIFGWHGAEPMKNE